MVEVGVNRVAVISLIGVARWGFLDGAPQLWLLLGRRGRCSRAVLEQELVDVNEILIGKFL